MVKVVGNIKFSTGILDVYSSLEDPLFAADDVAEMIGMNNGGVYHMLRMCEKDEVLDLPVTIGGQKRNTTFITESGLYNILSQSNRLIARKWRRVVHEELINLRKSRDMDISEQFEAWDDALDDIYYDYETDTLMRSITVAGGDVIQVPYKPEEE